jgi:DMSO/TMAO reductase YedYZ molybdopterin-dependent catalytic subunit
MTDEPEETKLTRTKRAWAAAGRFLTGQPGDPAQAGARRLPPGQHLVRDWPVLDLGVLPHVPLDRWRLDVTGLVERPLSLDWAAFGRLPRTESLSDIHCVTSWSRFDNAWQGVATRDLLDLAGVGPGAGAVMLHGHDGYATNLPLDDVAAEGSLLATHWDGKPLAPEHGGPLRAVVPHLYFWKSAKWLSRIEVLPADRPGFWERNGYHMRGDPWAEERYGEP